jgi:hypothetical protein
MGCDWVRLFNKRLCDEILAINNSALADFVASHLRQLDEYNEFRFGFAEEVPIPDRIRHLRESGISEPELKRILVDSLCVFGEWLNVDYWACYAEVFGDDPPGSVWDREIFPHLQSPHFLLLRPEHVDRMIGSLYAHRAEVTVMEEKDILLLTQWREQCSNDTSTMVAYFLDC